MQSILEANPQCHKLIIMDARPRINAEANKVSYTTFNIYSCTLLPLKSGEKVGDSIKTSQPENHF